MSVFQPTATTQLLISSVSAAIPVPGTLLDLGCGTGVIGLALARAGTARLPVYFSDVSTEAVQATCQATVELTAAVVRQGSLFAPWVGETFDVIVSDVSGMAEDAARVSPWFDGVPCDTGADGAALTCAMLTEAPRYLRPGGRLYFPVLSLADELRIIETAHDCFQRVTLLREQWWWLPEAMTTACLALQAQGIVRLKQLAGRWLWRTRIYEARG